jgi:hypothetical protein
MRETSDGVFEHCFLSISWNLGCRVNNAVHIKLRDIGWANSFDCFQILFAHTKTDPTWKSRVILDIYLQILLIRFGIRCCRLLFGESVKR